jgi:hypothetical protein
MGEVVLSLPFGTAEYGEWIYMRRKNIANQDSCVASWGVFGSGSRTP